MQERGFYSFFLFLKNKKSVENMSLDKEQAHRLADQIMDEAKQESIAKLNERKIRISFIYHHTGLMQLQPYQQAKIIQQAKEKALDHPVFQKAFYFYAFF